MDRPFSGAPDTIRTCDLCLRRVAVYPAELRAQCLAVQRPNESNPLGVCCDIVKPVFSDWTQLLRTSGWPGRRRQMGRCSSKLCLFRYRSGRTRRDHSNLPPSHGLWGRRSIDIGALFHTADRSSSGRLRDLDIASNAAGDIVDIRSALVEIR